MRKKFLLFLLGILVLTGCENKEEKMKSEYIAMKSNLLSATKYEEELPIDIIVSIDRVEEEKVNYKVLFQNPKENMHQIQAMVVHNYNNEDIFPSIGLFDEKQELLLNKENNTLELEGTIETAKNISKLDLHLKVWLKYLDDNGEQKDIYYGT